MSEEFDIVKLRANFERNNCVSVGLGCADYCESPWAASPSKVASEKEKRSWDWTTTKSVAGAACIGTSM